MMRRTLVAGFFIFFLLPGLMLFGGEFVIVNKTDTPLFEVFVSGVDDSGWSTDRIPYDVIMPGGYAVLQLEEYDGAGSLKFRFVDEDGAVYLKYNVEPAVRKKILVSPDDLEALSPEGMMEFTLVNQTGETITGLFISPETEESWGENLAGDYMTDGSDLTVKLASADDTPFYDIRFDLHGNTYIQKHVFLSDRARVLLTLQ